MKLLCSFFLLFILTACQTTTNTVDESNLSAENESAGDELLLEIDSEEGLTRLVEEEPLNEKLQTQPAGYENLWLKLAEGFEFEVPENSRIAKQRDYFLNNPNYLKQVSKRAEPFLYLIIEQIEAKNLPLELALLPVVESTFDPFAYSHASASGLWQFMPVTGERFGLKQDWWYDGRRDVYASTEAALRYMEILHDYLGDDWLHALAAYNSGEGRVQRAARKNKKLNKPTDYWNLDLPRETQEYVPKLLALVDILRNHQEYGVELPVIANKQVLTYIDTNSQIELAYAAEFSDLSVAEIQLLNPAFNHWATSPEGPHKLLVPTVSAEQFITKLSQIDDNKRIRWDRYKVRSGDSLSVIAKNYGTTTSVLKQINDLNGSMIRIGQPLLIPVASKSQQDYLYSQAKRFEQNDKGKRKVQHTVVEGDTLWDISRRYKVTSKQIASWNATSTKKTLRLGQELTIWKPLKAVSKNKIVYKVRSGDSLGLIAQKYKVKSADLERWNQLSGQKYIKPGQSLKIYTNTQSASHSAKAPSGNQTSRQITYKVRPGDSLGLIAQKYKVKSADLERWNQLSGQKYIKPGQSLKIYTNTQSASRSAKAPSGNQTSRQITYKVRPGDSLGAIAQKHKVKSADLQRWNQLKGQKYIQPGQNLKIFVNTSNSRNSAENQVTREVIYKVRSGDSLGLIASKFNVKTADLERWNQLNGSKYIQPGQELKVFVNVQSSRT
ncbi:LysM peptidoglycan-binding domain-containing protein [Psychromonas ossibalaenae]|uniref:LysM peptidoglycan-binding domain-containing protein n=1 Tax=Psychromonas ossibalaenae TaxID=444922 RepID=UPI00036E9847|nr:LysM peptidoglycan-binding domain-containing protein [Psychromonas ossibalaenae]